MTKDLLNRIVEIAQALKARNERMPARELAVRLNAEGFRTTYGTPYQGGRGSFRLLAIAHKSCMRSGDIADAEAIAHAFVAKNERPAWE